VEILAIAIDVLDLKDGSNFATLLDKVASWNIQRGYLIKQGRKV